MNFSPIEDKGSVRISQELGGFSRGIVGVEDEATCVCLFEEDNACRRDPVRSSGGQGHGLRFLDAVVDSVLEPCAELVDGRWMGS